jgi:hypothetical protein
MVLVRGRGGASGARGGGCLRGCGEGLIGCDGLTYAGFRI